ncbi:MAG: CYTH domain-containing protein [Lachnospiraceae bacterium]|nr:CYTH domain-containing protein [Lachnospiraceae bacterium]
MEIERKFTIKDFPENLDNFQSHEIEQAYLSVNPVVRIRKSDDEYYLTYKGSGMMVREEYNLPLNEHSYYHLLKKADGNIISKTRYLIPLNEHLTAELDIFHGVFTGMFLIEVEFASTEEANNFTPPDWFGEDVTRDPRYHNSYLSSVITEK